MKDEWLDGPTSYSKPSSSWVSTQEPKPLVDLSFQNLSHQKNTGKFNITPLTGIQSKSLKEAPTTSKYNSFSNQMTPKNNSTGPFSSFFAPYLSSSSSKTNDSLHRLPVQMAKGPFSSDTSHSSISNVATNESKPNNYYAAPDSIPPELQRYSFIYCSNIIQLDVRFCH
jgi:hypothetical protein